MRPRDDTADKVIARLAERTHGVVTRCELLRAGVTPAEIKRRLASGALIREYIGVFRVGHRAFSPEAAYLAAVRACGETAVLCGRAAAFLYGLVKDRPQPEVTTTVRRRHHGVKTVRARQIDPRDVTTRRGIPVTTVPRTIVDLAAVLAPAELARACHEAAVRYRVTPEAIEAVLARRPNSRGARKLRRVLRGDTPVTLSKLEQRFFQLLEQEGLPLPETNRRVDAHYVDCRWPDHRLTVELDSYRYHSSRHAWENDRRREREARGRGDELRRYTWGDVFEEPQPMLAELRVLLGVRRPSAAA